jgi:hypothetical protein
MAEKDQTRPAQLSDPQGRFSKSPLGHVGAAILAARNGRAEVRDCSKSWKDCGREESHG